MYKQLLISCLLFCLLTFGTIIPLFLYNEKSQKIIINLFKINNIINQKVQSYILEQTNDKSLIIKLSDIKFLEPNWPNIIRIKIENIDINSGKLKVISNLKNVELGISYINLLEKEFSFDYLDIKNITSNGIIGKNQFYPGPIMNAILVMNNKKQYLEKNIFIGNINLILLDDRDDLKKRLIYLNCNKISISSFQKKYRTVSSICKDNSSSEFSIEGKLLSNVNIFKGYAKNLNLENLTGINLFNNFNNKKIKSESRLNGTYIFKTNKKFKLEELKFISTNSILKVKGPNKNIVNKQLKINGDFFWNKKRQKLTFLNLLFDNIVMVNGKFNFKNRKGNVKFNLVEISLLNLKKMIKEQFYILKSVLNIDEAIHKYPIKLKLNQLKGGLLNNTNISVDFIFLNKPQKVNIIKISGNSQFTNILLDYNNEYIKNFFSHISGELKFRQIFNTSETSKKNRWVQLDLKAYDGSILTTSSLPNYKFDLSNIKLSIINNSLDILNADFYRDNKLDYSFKDITISDEDLIEGYLKIKSNNDLLKKLQKENNIKLFGVSDLFFKIYGNIQKLNFKLDLNSDLKNSSFEVPFINLIKKKNVKSSIKSQIFIEKGKIKYSKNTTLKIENETLKLDEIFFDYNKKNIITLKNIITPIMNLNEIKISNINNKLEIEASGKLLDLTGFRKKIENNRFHNSNKFDFDVTVNKIIFDPNISISGNLKGKKRGNTLQAVALGKMWLRKSPILDSGKLQILINNNSSNIESIGLIGGAETKIILNKIKNQLPTISFDTIDGGKLLSALNFTNKLRSGKMTINLQFLDNTYDHYEGEIKASDFSLVNTPGIINSLSILSFSGIESILTGEGVSFDNGEAKIYVKDNIFNFDPLLLSSESLGVHARGKINLYNQEIDLRGALAPIKMISNIISEVPAVGELITGFKKDGLFAGQFKMIGFVKDPKVTLNTLSFAPGILREIFSMDWLDKDNFFVKNKFN